MKTLHILVILTMLGSLRTEHRAILASIASLQARTAVAYTSEWPEMIDEFRAIVAAVTAHEELERTLVLDASRE